MVSSALRNMNLDVLYQYMAHRIYDFNLPYPAVITNTEKDGIFIPAGFDSMRLISELGKMDNKKKVEGIDSADSDGDNDADNFDKPFDEVLN